MKEKMKHCDECKYCLARTLIPSCYTCTAPQAIAIHDMAMISSKEKPYCTDMRNKCYKYCGPDAKWYVAKEQL